MILNILFAIYTLISIVILMRASMVLGYRNGLLQCIRVISIVDYNSCAITAFEWRFAVFNSVSFFKMVFVFWKPLMKVDSWWSDTSFLEPTKFANANVRGEVSG